MIQVNLRDHNTRLVEYRLEAALTDEPGAATSTVDGPTSDCITEPEPELEQQFEATASAGPELKLNAEPAERSVWQCAFGESVDSPVGWAAYPDDIQAKLSGAYAKDPTATFQFEETRHFAATDRYPAKTETFRYSIDFSAAPNFLQTNLKSQKQRPVRRRECWCTTPEARARAGTGPLRILCIDGGGTRGLVPAIVLQRIEEVCAPHRVDELFDVVAGTSTGGARSD
jgi:hypothetical protein